MPMKAPTPAEIAQHYRAAMDSVNLINAIAAQSQHRAPEDHAC
jgi:hypothetical protein